MRIWLKSRIKSWNEELSLKLKDKYNERIKRVQVDQDNKDEFVNIISECSKEYKQEAKGTENLYELTELLRFLYKNIFIIIYNKTKLVKK